MAKESIKFIKITDADGYHHRLNLRNIVDLRIDPQQTSIGRTHQPVHTVKIYTVDGNNFTIYLSTLQIQELDKALPMLKI